MIKNFICSTLIGAFVFELFYLLGSFYSTTFDIGKWSSDTIGLISTLGGMFGLFSLVIAFLFNLTKKKIYDTRTTSTSFN